MNEGVHGILVGYDGSPASGGALSWAAREARLRGIVLTVCAAPEPEPAVRPVGARSDGECLLAEGLRQARAIMAAADVRSLPASGPAARTLCEHSASAEMVVVGCRGRGGFDGLLLGSVSAQVAAHASGRVVVVRGHWRLAGGYVPGPVVVGVDGSPASDAAAEFAFEEAVLHEVPLLAVCALADTAGSLGVAHRVEKDFEQVIDHWQKEHPEVAVHRQVADGPARQALLDRAAAAQLLVVGARGRGGVRGMALGSVSHALLQHAACPVAVVH